MSIKIECEMTAKELAYHLTENDILDIISEKIHYQKVAQWVVDNFDMTDIINRYGIKNTLSHIKEEDLLDECSAESIAERHYSNAPLTKLL
jgi:hypothetical protein